MGDISDGTVVAIGAGAKAVYQQGLSLEEVAALVVELKEQNQALVWDYWPALAQTIVE